VKKAVFLTTYNRLPYLQQVLESWSNVRGSEDWDFYAMIEPSPVASQIVEEFEEFKSRNSHLFRNFTIWVNPQVYGVLHHPWVGFERLLKMNNYDFAVRAEDDLMVSDDILEFFSWAAEEYRGDDQVVTAHAFSLDDGDPSISRASEAFSPWLWGTWKDDWSTLIGPTWDHNYSTYNGTPGHQSGWDWNLNTRLFPEYDLRSVCPVVSRVQNIGVTGVHGTPENFSQAPSFLSHRDKVSWTRADSIPHGRSESS